MIPIILHVESNKNPIRLKRSLYSISKWCKTGFQVFVCSDKDWIEIEAVTKLFLPAVKIEYVTEDFLPWYAQINRLHLFMADGIILLDDAVKEMFIKSDEYCIVMPKIFELRRYIYEHLDDMGANLSNVMIEESKKYPVFEGCDKIALIRSTKTDLTNSVLCDNFVLYQEDVG